MSIKNYYMIIIDIAMNHLRMKMAEDRILRIIYRWKSQF